MNADQLIAQVLEGADPEKVVVDLVERKRAPTIIAFHGTSLKRWKKIKREGLKPGGVEKNWGTGLGLFNKPSQQSVGGVYFSRSVLGTGSSRYGAWEAAEDVAAKDNSKPLIIVAQIQPRSAGFDEDEFVSGLIMSIRGAMSAAGFNLTEPRNLYRFYMYTEKDELLSDDQTGDKARKLLQGYRKGRKNFKDAMPAYLAQAHPGLRYGEFDPRFLEAYQQEGIALADAEVYRRMGMLNKNHNQYRGKFGKHHTAEKTAGYWRRAVAALSKRLGRFMVADPPSRQGNPFGENLRLSEPVDFKGRNKIIAAAYRDLGSAYTGVWNVVYGTPSIFTKHTAFSAE